MAMEEIAAELDQTDRPTIRKIVNVNTRDGSRSYQARPGTYGPWLDALDARAHKNVIVDSLAELIISMTRDVYLSLWR